MIVVFYNCILLAYLTSFLHKNLYMYAYFLFSAQMQYQPVLSEGRPLSARGRTLPGKQGTHRSSEVRLSQTSDPGIY